MKKKWRVEGRLFKNQFRATDYALELVAQGWGKVQVEWFHSGEWSVFCTAEGHVMPAEGAEARLHELESRPNTILLPFAVGWKSDLTRN